MSYPGAQSVDNFCVGVTVGHIIRRDGRGADGVVQAHRTGAIRRSRAVFPSRGGVSVAALPSTPSSRSAYEQARLLSLLLGVDAKRTGWSWCAQVALTTKTKAPPEERWTRSDGVVQAHRTGVIRRSRAVFPSRGGATRSDGVVMVCTSSPDHKERPRSRHSPPEEGCREATG